MYDDSIESLFSFRLVKIKSFFKIKEPDLESIYFLILRSDKRYTPIFHKCKNKAEGIYSWHKRKIRNLDIPGVECNVNSHYRKIHCPNCGIRVEKTGLTSPGGQRVTNRLTQYTQELCQHMTVKKLAEHLNLHQEIARKIYWKVSQKIWGNQLFPFRIIDGRIILLGEYHKCLTVVLDFKTNCIIWLKKSCKTVTWNEFF